MSCLTVSNAELCRAFRRGQCTGSTLLLVRLHSEPLQANKSGKSLCTAPSCITVSDMKFLELVEAFLYPAVLQIFVHDSCETKTCSQLHCTVQCRQKNNGCKCGKRSTTNTDDYYVTRALRTFEITCKCKGRNNLEFTFHLMTFSLLNSERFQNLKYFIRSKGFLAHLEKQFYIPQV